MTLHDFNLFSLGSQNRDVQHTIEVLGVCKSGHPATGSMLAAMMKNADQRESREQK